MKKNTFLLLLFIVSTFFCHAQLFNEDFGAGSSWQSWTQIDADGSGGLVWFSSGSKMSSLSYDGTQYDPDHYIITPAINVDGATGLYLMYKAGGRFTGLSEEVFTIYVSNGNTVPDFLTPGSTGAITVSSGTIELVDHFPEANGGLANFLLDVSSLIGESEIYIAFRHHDTNTNQSTLHFDDVILSETLGIEDYSFDDFKYFVDLNNILQLSSNNKKLDGLIMYNMLGQEVLNIKLTSVQESIDISKFSKGVYIIGVSIDDIHRKFKIINN